MDNTIENQIIKLVDNFINTMIEMHNAVPGQEEELYAQAEGLLLELTDKALLLLGGREEYLETMLSQLITQKLPQGAVIDCFGNFKEELDQVMARTLDVYHRQQLGLGADTDLWNEFADEEDSEDLEGEEDRPHAEVQEESEAEYNELEEYDEFEEEKEEEEEEEGCDSVIVVDTTEGSAPDGEEAAQRVTSPNSESGGSQEVNASEGDSDAEPEADSEADPEGDSAEDEALGSEAVEIQESEFEEAAEEDPLGVLIRRAFAGQETIRNYSIYDIIIDWFIPETGLGFISPKEGDSISNIGDLALRRAGIYLIKVDPEGIYNVKSFKRRLRRLLLEKYSEDKRIFDFSAE